MGDPLTTVWTVIDGAAAGMGPARDKFAVLYSPVVRAYLLARWRGTHLIQEVDDAEQNTFIDLFRDGGALTRARREQGSFRAYLFGLVRNIALRHERAAARRLPLRPAGLDLELLAARDEPLSRLFDRTWARAIVRHAAAVYVERARVEGGHAEVRARILELRFGEDLPIRTIAAELAIEAEQAHRDYAAARRVYQEVLAEVVRDAMGIPFGNVEAECRRLLEHLRS